MIALLLASLLGAPLACPPGSHPVGQPPPLGNAEWCVGPDRAGA